MITPRWYQEEAILAIYNYFANGGKGNPIVALPTASGKSIIPAIFIERVMRQWPSQRFLLMSHVKELIAQNAEKLLNVWAEAPLGIHSAGLKSRDTAHPIVFGGVQSMIKNANIFGWRDLIFIDECHLVSDNDSSMYLSFIALMRLINPQVRVIGLSATPYRMGMGMLTEGGLFTDIVYDMTDINGFNKLLSEGYLSPLIPIRTRTELDVSEVGVQKGEFVATQLQGAVDKAEVTYKALQELVHYGKNRRSWLIFSSGVNHAEHIAEQLSAFGIECAPVHSKRPDDYNDAAIAAFKNYELQAIVCYSKLTTGFDHPGVDIIADFRPTLSIPLHVQKYGRGMRIAEGKENCLCLDFARNVPRLGCVNDPIIPNKKGNKSGEIPVKLCESCGAYNHISARICCQCSEVFSFAVKIVSKSGTDELIKSAATEPTPIIETFPVLNTIYLKNEGKFGKPSTIKVVYFTATGKYNEFVCLEHNGMAGKMARDWWRRRIASEPPATIDAALPFVSNLKCPRFIRVHTNLKPWPAILGVEF